MRLQGHNLAASCKVILEDGGNVAKSHSCGNHGSFLVGVLDVNVIHVILQHFPCLEGVNTALYEVGGIEYRTHLGECLEDLKATLGGLTVDLLLVLVAEGNRVGGQVVKLLQMLKVDGEHILVLYVGNGVEAEHTDSFCPQNVGILQHSLEGIHVLAEICLLQVELTDGRADGPNLDALGIQHGADLLCLGGGDLADVLSVYAADLQKGNAVALHSGDLTSDLGGCLVGKCTQSVHLARLLRLPSMRRSRRQREQPHRSQSRMHCCRRASREYPAAPRACRSVPWG